MSPAEQLADALLACRARHTPFDTAWQTALNGLVWPVDPVEAAQWRQAIVWARSEFADAYEHPHTVPGFVTRVLAREDLAGLSGRHLAQLAGAERPVRMLGVPVDP